MSTKDEKTADALRVELQADAHAARIRDYGAEDAATYEQRVAQGSRTVQYLDPGAADRDQWMAKLPIDDELRKELAIDLDRIKRDTYVELEVQVAGWNYTRGEDGYPFHELPVRDREVLVEDYVDWDKYKRHGLTDSNQLEIMYEAARDPFPPGTPESEKIASIMADTAARNVGLETVMREKAASNEYQKMLDDAAGRGSNKSKEHCHER